MLVCLLATVVVPVGCARHFTRCAAETKIRSDLRALEQLFRVCIGEHGAPPATWSDLARDAGLTPPLDPWKNDYLLEVHAPQRAARIGTLGRDAAPGGSGDDADFFVDVCW